MAKHRSGFVQLPGSIGRPLPQLPVGSVLALAERRPEAIVTIGRWRIVGTPGRPPRYNSAACPGPQQRSSERAGHHHQRLLQLPIPRRALPQPAQESQAPDQLAPEQQASEQERSAQQRSAQQRSAQPAGAADRRLREPRAQAPRRVPRSPATCRGFRDPERDQAHERGHIQPSRRPERALDRLPAMEPQPFTWSAGSAVSWALLSQVFWIPLVAIDLHDRWVAHQREVTPPGQPLAPAPIARATSFALNDLLGAVRPAQQLAGQAAQVVRTPLADAVRAASSQAGALLSSAGSGASSLLDRPFTQSLDRPASDGSRSTAAPRPFSGGTGSSSANTLLGRVFTRAQLLGGSISLNDLQEGPMAPLALAERALQRGSGDPLAPLPSLWREPMRQALQKLPGAPAQLSPARAVIVPSRAVLRPVEVPLALQSDGSVDVLEPPSDPAVLREVEGWSRQQRPPASGSVQPALLHLHPLSDAGPAPAGGSSSAAIPVPILREAPAAPLPAEAASPVPPAP